MMTNSATKIDKAQTERIAALLARTRELTQAAARNLGLGNEAAVQAADDGGFLLDGQLVTVTPLPTATMDSADDDRLVISAMTGIRLEDIGLQNIASLLAQAPGLLASFDAVPGCSPDGEIMLHRLWKESKADGTLAQEMVVARRLAQLVIDHTQPAGEQ